MGLLVIELGRVAATLYSSNLADAHSDGACAPLKGGNE